MLSMFRKSPAPALDPAAISAQVAAGTLTLVDIRDPSEVAASGKAAGALAIPLSTLRLKADPQSPDHDPRLSPDRPIALYCASGARASMARGTLQQLGYRDVTNLGGLADWARAGGAIIRG
ncbi:MAG: sulfurtransferase [Rubellimicrobium sp.]|nr:sulfurtransferase [Rubellimicrobium sp.]